MQATQIRTPIILISSLLFAVFVIAWAWWPDRDESGNDFSIPSTTGVNPTNVDTAPAVVPGNARSAWDEIDDSSRDGWDSETQANEAHVLLEILGREVFEGSTLDTIESICDSEIDFSPLLPERLVRIYEDNVIRVDRWNLADDGHRSDPSALHGIDAFGKSLRDLSLAWNALTQKRFEFKIFRVEPSSNSFVTHQYVSVAGRTEERFVEQHATWITKWSRQTGTHKLRLQSINVVDFEQATSSSHGCLFADCTSSVLKKNDCYRNQFLYGMNYWLDRIQDMRYFSPLGNPGLSVGDVNNDGLDDLYVCQESNLPNRLFVQQADGTALDVSSEWHVDWLESSRSALLVDFDNDGDQDLAVAILGGIVVASNEGSRFDIRNVLKTNDDTTSLTAADYDLDGRLDLYVCVDYPNDTLGSKQTNTIQVGSPSRVYHDANTAGNNSLFRNQHSEQTPWRFVDATQATGLDQNNHRFTWAAAWDDFDNDGDQDLYVANDFGRNNLYANNGGKFNDIALAANAEDSASGMSVAWEDFNRDGNMDVYVANMFSSAGSRISHQPDFKPNAMPEVRSRLQRFARGSTLLKNSGEGQFEDVSIQADVNLGRWAWSSNFLDINNDGWQDIAVANGYITSDDTSDL